MKLQALRLHGFKSFADRTELRFHDGVTAIVGPNGCGKSNISDAVRWVLGEQKASAIRSARMDDAIFQGTAQRRAVSRAEVEVVVSNDDGALPVPYKSVELRRTVFRDGGSEYSINRNPSRLRDILDLCRDTGLGANAYAIIEQGMVDSILSDRNEDRRHMFEEAAGIGRYKDRRKAAQRRLEHAETDLSRLQDVIAEVETKVRSLARQKGKAQRYVEYRERRLALEIALADAELHSVAEELKSLDARLESLRTDEPGTRGELSTAEAELEKRRIAAAEATRARGELASRAEELSRRIADAERRMAVADERRGNAERRIEQIGQEREGLHRRIATLESELEELSGARTAAREKLERLRQEEGTVGARAEELRGAFGAARREEAESAVEEETTAREVHRLEGVAAGGEARAADAAARLARLVGEREELAEQRTGLNEQGDLFADRRRELEGAIEAARGHRDELRQRTADAREALAQATRRLVEAEDEAARLASELAATEASMRDFAAFAPVVAAVMRSGDVDGLRGPLADALSLSEDRAAEVEAALGSLLQVLVVRDDAAAEAVARWLDTREDAEGVLGLIAERDLPRARELVEAVRVAGRVRAAPSLVGRRERVERLRAAADSSREARDTRAAERDELAGRLEAAEQAARDAEHALHERELELRRVTADESARSERGARLDRLAAELDEEEVALERTIEEAQAESREAREKAGTLRVELEQARERRRVEAEAVEARRSEWETAREAHSEARVALTRVEAELEAADRRAGAADASIAEARQRLAQLEREEKESEQAAAGAREERGGAESGLDDLFRERDALSTQLREHDAVAGDATERSEQLERRVRELRTFLDRSGEERHKLELRRADLSGAERRIRERLEAEWSKPIEQLRREAGTVAEIDDGSIGPADLEALRAMLTEVTASIERLGPVNMLAVEEHEEESRRLEFLTAQRDDLQKARDDLQSAIRRINRAARDLFMDTFTRVRENFLNTFQALFEGGECDLWLADPEDPLESPIEISASPRGKRTQRIHLLSGGERALTALALLFAIYLVKPSPFCVLDEVDAPLDEANIGRFLAMLRRFKASTQFVVITHNPRTMEAADWIYGVTMEEPGVSTIVGVELDEVAPGEAAAALA